jgi:hypothetical protein
LRTTCGYGSRGGTPWCCVVPSLLLGSRVQSLGSRGSGCGGAEYRRGYGGGARQLDSGPEGVAKAVVTNWAACCTRETDAVPVGCYVNPGRRLRRSPDADADSDLFHFLGGRPMGLSLACILADVPRGLGLLLRLAATPPLSHSAAHSELAAPTPDSRLFCHIALISRTY